MTTVASGSKVLVHGSQSTVTLRSLRSVDLDGGWSVGVLGDLGQLEAAGVSAPLVDVEFVIDGTRVRLDAELVKSEGVFLLRAPGLRTAALEEQRRENVRALIRLPLRGTVLTASDSPTRPRGDEQVSGDIQLSGVTRTVSGGGISVELEEQSGVVPGTTIYIELEMPSGELAPAVLTVVEQEGPTVRARFVDISPLDRERLVRLVFTRQRAELAERRRAAAYQT